MLKNRRRSLSASRTFDQTVNLVGKIGASLRLSSRMKKAKETSFTIVTSGHLEVVDDGHKQHQRGSGGSEGWFRSRERSARVDVERRRSTRSDVYHAISADNRKSQLMNSLPPYSLDHRSSVEGDPSTKRQRSAAVTGGLTEGGRNNQASSSSVEGRLRGVSFGGGRLATTKRSLSTERLGAAMAMVRESPIQFMDDDGDEEDSEAEEHLSALALIPVFHHGGRQAAQGGHRSLSALSSPISSIGSGGHRIGTRSCPSTPAMSRRRYLKEGAVQLTSLSTLQTHHRYFFLFNDLLLVSKQKGENSYKLKEKIALDNVWATSNNCTNSFLIGWPIRNYIAHFSSESDKIEWLEKIGSCIKRRLRPKATTVSLALAVEGRQQLIRREIRNGVCASEIVEQLKRELNLPELDPNLASYKLCFETGPDSSTFPIIQRRSHSQSVLTSASTGVRLPSSSAAAATTGGGHSSTATLTSSTLSAAGPRIQPLHGVENVYAILMDYVTTNQQPGVNLSESQLSHLDTCPLVNCRLVLRQNNVTHSLSSTSTHTALKFVNQIRKVLGRTDGSNSKNRLFGCRLQGSMPPQTILTLIDHLLIYGSDVEGIFRKSPKHETFRILRSQLDQGLVPDFHQFNIHVAASLLKDYLRSIPGQLLISGNYQLWMQIVELVSRPDKQRQLCRQLLCLLPPAHTVLLKSLIRMLRKITANEGKTRMNANSLSICFAPCLLEDTNLVDSARRVPELIIYLMENAPDLLDGFSEDGPLLDSGSSCTTVSRPATDIDEDEQRGTLHLSTDSGLSDDITINSSNNGFTKGANKKTSPMSASMICQPIGGDDRPSREFGSRRRRSVSPDSALFDLPLSDSSGDYEANGHNNHMMGNRSNGNASGIRIEDVTQKMVEDKRQRFWHSARLNDEEKSMDFYEENEDDRTPVALSREPSDVKTQFTSKCGWHSDNLPSPTVRRGESMMTTAKYAAGVNEDTLKASQQARNDAAKASGDYGIIRRSRLNDHASKQRQTSVIKNRKEASMDGSSFDGGSPAPRKASTTSIDSGGRSSVASGGLPRRSILSSKTETLGLQSPSFAEDRGPLVGPQKHILARQSPLSKDSPIATVKTPLSRVKSPLQRTTPQNYEIHGVCVKATASKFCKPGEQSISMMYSSSSSPSSTKQQSDSVSAVRGATNTLQQNGAASNSSNTRNSPATNNNALQRTQTMVANNGGAISSAIRRRPPNLDFTNSNPGSQRKNGVCGREPQTPVTPKYRPPKRTAEEILLDKLEVNWSVPDIRKTFQQHSQILKPIDTVYAKLPST